MRKSINTGPSCRIIRKKHRASGGKSQLEKPFYRHVTLNTLHKESTKVEDVKEVEESDPCSRG